MLNCQYVQEFLFRLYFSYWTRVYHSRGGGNPLHFIDSRLRGNDTKAGVAKLADALALGASTARYAGSSPVPGTSAVQTKRKGGCGAGPAGESPLGGTLVFSALVLCIPIYI